MLYLTNHITTDLLYIEYNLSNERRLEDWLTLVAAVCDLALIIAEMQGKQS